jgi:sugar diacid utilization regulator
VTTRADRVARLAKTLRQQRRLLADAARGQALQEAIDYAAAESGLKLWVLTTTGRLLATSSGALAVEQLDAITTAAVAAARLPAAASVGDVRYTVFDVDGDGGRRRLSRWLVAVEGEPRSWPRPTTEAVAEIAAIAAIDRSRRDAERAAWREIADAAFQLLANDEAARAEIYLRQLGVDVDAPAVLVVAGLSKRSHPRSEVRQLVEDAVAHVASPSPVVGIGAADEVVALIQPAAADEVSMLDALGRSLARIGPGLRRDRLTAGVSMQATITSLGGAVRAARFARQLAVNTELPVEVAYDRDVRSARLLLNSAPDVLRTAFAERVLGPVLSYDVRAAGELLPTLEAFFACDGSWSKTADRLGLHINTVRYRIARIEQLTERSVAHTDGRMDLYAALTLLRPAG